MYICIDFYIYIWYISVALENIILFKEGSDVFSYDIHQLRHIVSKAYFDYVPFFLPCMQNKN